MNFFAKFFSRRSDVPAERKSGGLSPTLQAFLTGGSTGSADELRKPYAQSVWVHRAIRYVSGPLESVPLLWTQDKRGGDVTVEDAELTAFWERPAVTRGGTMARADFIAALVGWYLLKGEFFLVLDDTWLSTGGRKSPLMVARPDEMQPILGDEMQLAGWFYLSAGGRREALIPEQVIQVKAWNPYDDFRGLADWEAARIAADSDYAAGVFARNLMKNNGDRGPYVIGKDGVASDEQQKQITAMLRQKRELSRRGDFRPVFLTGDIEVHEPGLQAVDAAYVAQRMANAYETFLAFGVPPSFATVTASYSIGSASDRFKLIEETCMPIAAKLADAFERVEQLRTGRQVFCEFDFDEHSTLQQVRSERFSAAKDGLDRGMPWRVASDYFRLKLPRFPGDDVGRVPFNLVEIGTEPEPEGGDEAPTEADPYEELKAAFTVRSKSGETPVKPCCEHHGKAQTKAAAEIWAKVHKAREPWEARMKKRISRYLMDARAETLRNLAAQTEPKAQGKALDPIEILFDLGQWITEWTRGLIEIERNALERAGFELWTDELGKTDPLVMPAENVDLALAIRRNRIKNAGERVWQTVKGKVEKAIADGMPNEELAKEIKRVFAGIDEQRSRTIANTEITAAYEVARDMTFQTAGVEWTQWVAAGDGRERDTHRQADGQIRESGTPFDVGLAKLLFPGDPSGPPEEVINCRCVRIAVPGPDTTDTEGDSDDIPY